MLYHGGSEETIASPSRLIFPVQLYHERDGSLIGKSTQKHVIALFRKEFISSNKGKSFWGKEFGAF